MQTNAVGNQSSRRASRVLRFGLVGAGMVSDVHARSLLECDDVELSVVYSRSEARAKGFAEKYAVDWTTDVDRVLECPDLDAVIVTTAPYNHASQAIAAMRAGRHVLVEKPMAVSSAECDEMIRTAEQTDRRLGVIFQSRFKKPVGRIKQLLDEGQLGGLLHVSGYVKWYRPQEYYEANDWRGRVDREGGGVIFSQAGHTLDLMRWIGGPVEWVFTNMVTAPVHQGIEIENLATVTLRFVNGATGTLEAATALYPGKPEQLEIHTTRGTVVLEAGNIVSWDVRDVDEPDDLEEESGSGASDPMAFPNTWHKRQIADFISAIHENRPPLVDGHEGRRLNDLCGMIYQSATVGGVVRGDHSRETASPSQMEVPARVAAKDRPLILMDPYPRPIKLIFSPEDRDRLNALGRVLWYEGIRAPDEHIEAHLAETVALIGQTPMPRERLDRAVKLQAIFNVEGNFLPNVDYVECHRRNIHVLNCSRAFAPAVAELALGLALAAARGIVQSDAAFRRGEEKYSAASNRESKLLRGATMGLLGCGNVARALVPLIRPLAGQILVCDPWLHSHFVEDLGLVPVDLDALMRRSDILFVLSAATSENGHQLGAQQLATMHQGAIVVLVGRAEVVEFDALLDAANSGWIRAAIDVFPEEPVPSNHRVRTTDNVILSGHRAGGLPETYREVGRMVVDDLEMILRGLPPVRMQPAVLETVQRQRSKPITAGAMK